MHTIAVGQALRPGVTRYAEIPEYNYRSGNHLLIIPMDRPAPDEIAAVRSAGAKFAFTTIGPVLIFQFRFGDALPWSDAAYTPHKIPPADWTPPPTLTGDQRVPLQIILVNAATGIVEAIRLVTLSPTFSRRLHQAIQRLKAQPLPADYDAQAQRVFDVYTSAQLRDRALASCTGGDTTDRPSPY